jgi:hypothetical protein
VTPEAALAAVDTMVSVAAAVTAASAQNAISQNNSTIQRAPCKNLTLIARKFRKIANCRPKVSGTHEIAVHPEKTDSRTPNCGAGMLWKMWDHRALSSAQARKNTSTLASLTSLLLQGLLLGIGLGRVGLGIVGENAQRVGGRRWQCRARARG